MQSTLKFNRYLLAPAVIFLFCGVWLTGCQGVTGSSAAAPTPAPTPTATPATLNSINHIVLFMQENRSFDHYFGQLNTYRAANGLPQDVDTWTSGTDKTPTNVSTVGFDPATSGFGPPIHAFHMQSQCSENLSPSWNESHVDFNLHNQRSTTSFAMDGFAWVQGKFANNHTAPPENFKDVTGKRAMGYYDQTDLPFYYFMASNFATSDRWFSPAPTRTHPNRLYWLAATSQGLVVPPAHQIAQKTIFQLMDENNVTWKIYSTDGTSYYFFFGYSNTHRANVVPLAQYFTDVQNGTLPQVAYIETGIEKNEGGSIGVDEHPKSRVQSGAVFAANLITKLMNSPSWKDTVFIETFDEGGGFYDHVPPMPVVNPDGIKPVLDPTDIPGDFTLSGFRVPLIVISPFSKKNFVSHQPMDSTAALKMIETRFKLPSLTARDASMPDMWIEFFDFSTATGPWATPPTPPPQPDTLPCTFGVPAG
jgi:phospholipase C